MLNSFFFHSLSGFEIEKRRQSYILEKGTSTSWIMDELMNNPSFYADSDTEEMSFMDIDPSETIIGNY
jgi:hypothetical protein